MTEQVMQEILQRLDVLALKMGTTGEYLWGVLIKQAYVDGYIGIVMMLVPAIIIFTFIKKFNSIKEWVVEHADPDIAVVLGGFIGLIAFALLCACFIDGVNQAKQLFNPEFFALQHIL